MSPITSNYGGAQLQPYTVATTGTFSPVGFGAQGRSDGVGATGGDGAKTAGSLALQTGEQILVLAGGKGSNGSATLSSKGGGTFVYLDVSKDSLTDRGDTLLLAAGGGGAAGSGNNRAGGQGVVAGRGSVTGGMGEGLATLTAVEAPASTAWAGTGMLSVAVEGRRASKAAALATMTVSAVVVAAAGLAAVEAAEPVAAVAAGSTGAVKFTDIAHGALA